MPDERAAARLACSLPDHLKGIGHPEPAQRSHQEGCGQAAGLVRQHLNVDQLDVIIDLNMKAVVFSSCAGIAPVVCDAIAHTHKTSQFLDTQVDQLARVLTLIAPGRLLQLQGQQGAQSVSSE